MVRTRIDGQVQAPQILGAHREPTGPGKHDPHDVGIGTQLDET